MFCCLSGQVPKEPVVSRANGCLYEKRLIERYLDEHGKCPRTGQPMAKTDLIAVSTGAGATGGTATAAATAAARSNPAASGIPGLLEVLHGEWDALMLEQFALRQELGTVKQELSHALYQHQAACRVIANLIAERDALKQELLQRGGASAVKAAAATQQQQPQRGGAGDEDGEEDDDDDEVEYALPSRICDELDMLADRLMSSRKARQVSRRVATVQNIEAFGEVQDATPHGTTSSPTCVDYLQNEHQKFVFTGGYDARVVGYDVKRGSVFANMVAHTKLVRAVKAADDHVVSCGDDGTTRVWVHDSGAYQNKLVIKGHSGEVTGLAMLPLRGFGLTCGSDKKLAFNDFRDGVCVATGAADGDLASALSCVEVHPDGGIAGTGSATNLLLWDVKSMEVELAIPHGANSGMLTCLDFAQDGKTIAVGTSRGYCYLWDIRQTKKPLKTLLQDSGEGAISSVRFDYSASFLACGSASSVVKLFSLGTGDAAAASASRSIGSLPAHQQAITGLVWGEHAQSLVTVSRDSHLKIFSNAAE